MKTLIALLLLVPSLAFAQVELKTDTFKIIEVQQKNGTSKMEWVSADSIVPGDKVGYRITVNNKGAEDAADIVLNNPVPENTVYVTDSARGANSNIEFSVDGGKQYSKPTQLFITKDGKKQPATAKDYTHVRWTLLKPLGARSESSVQYAVQVK
jgi:uncharacterized repeat protein (TIGR01451 family)